MISIKDFVPTGTEHYCNKKTFSNAYPEALKSSLSLKDTQHAINEISAWQGYQPTPLCSLKNLAKELNVPILAPSQLSRAVETRGGDKRPMLSDLRESGAIEQDADMVLFLYRPEYYGITEDELGNPTQGVTEVIIAKHRNGSLDSVALKFIGKYTKFADLDIVPFSNYNNYDALGTITKTSRANDTNLNSLESDPSNPFI